jgi:two-component system KDP operon response regulator KdpE
VSDPAVILVIEDDPHTLAVLQVTLAQHGYQCVHAPNGAQGVAAAFDYWPHVVLLDLGLPDLDGVEVTRRIRQRSDAPIIVVSARAQESDKIAALDQGANDYVTKPFLAGELLARIRVALRRPQTESGRESGCLTLGDLSIDFDVHRVTLAGTPIHVTPTEFRLLSLLLRSAGRVLTHEHILRHVWGAQSTANANYLRVYMKKLRYKIEPEPANPKYLLNEPGIGYRLRIPG